MIREFSKQDYEARKLALDVALKIVEIQARGDPVFGQVLVERIDMYRDKYYKFLISTTQEKIDE